ncbi:hypothetical protein ACX0HA_05365 [Flavobacterium hauense]
MKIVKEAIYASIFGAGVCMASCGKNNNEGHSTEYTSDSISVSHKDGIDTEMDSIVSPDTVMPAP